MLIHSLRNCLLLLACIGIVGCASSGETAIYPVRKQSGDVEQMVRQDLTFLQSTKENSSVTVSLRAATDEYMRAYVSISNRQGESVSVTPSSITVTTLEGPDRTFSAYAPYEVPGVVARSGVRDSDLLAMLNESSGLTGQRYRGTEQTGSTAGSYAGSQDDSEAPEDLMLKDGTLTSGNAVGGLVYTPFSKNVKRFRITVPVGETNHNFVYRIDEVGE